MSSTTATATATTNVNANVDANTIEVVAKSAILLPPTVSLGQHERGKHGKGQLVVALKELDYGEDENDDDDSKNSGVNVDTKVEVDHYRRKINLEKYITESVFGHLYRGSEYNYDILSNGNKVGNGEQKCQQQQQKYPQQQLIETHIAKKAVKCIYVHKYNEHQENIRNHRDCSEDPNNEIRIKAHIESKSSINIAFDNHIILPQYVLTNRNQSQSLIQHEGHQKQQQQQKQQQEQEQQRKRKRKQQQERYYFIVSQWADGGALIDQFTGLDEDQSKHLFRKMAEGIKYLHDLNIFHRDLKPDNVVTKNECSPSTTNVNDCTTNTSAATNTASSSSSSSSSSTIGPTNAETQDAFIIDFGQAQVIQDGVNEIEKSGKYGTVSTENIRKRSKERESSR